MKKIFSLLFIAGLFTGLFAGEEENFSAHAELSYADTAGNTESKDVAGNLKLKYPFYQNAIRFEGNILYSQNDTFDENGTYTDTVRTKNRWDAEANYDYNFNEVIAFNYIAGAKGDEFSTFVYQIYTGPGAILTAVKNDEHDLKFQGNILWAWDENREPYKADSNDTMHSYAAYQVSMDYVYQFTKNAKFIQYLMYRSEFEDTTNYFGKSKTAVEAKVSDIFSMGVSYTVDYTNNKAADVRSHTDRVFLASLIADF
jgi:putative salt-induced outer membrane protein YdiY